MNKKTQTSKRRTSVAVGSDALVRRKHGHQYIQIDATEIRSVCRQLATALGYEADDDVRIELQYMFSASAHQMITTAVEVRSELEGIEETHQIYWNCEQWDAGDVLRNLVRKISDVKAEKNARIRAEALAKLTPEEIDALRLPNNQGQTTAPAASPKHPGS